MVLKELIEGQLLLNINRNISTENSAKHLGWYPKYTNQDIINDTIESLLKHQR